MALSIGPRLRFHPLREESLTATEFDVECFEVRRDDNETMGGKAYLVTLGEVEDDAQEIHLAKSAKSILVYQSERHYALVGLTALLVFFVTLLLAGFIHQAISPVSLEAVR